MIKALYFDLGGVIVRTDDQRPRTALAVKYGMTYAQMDSFVFGSETAKQASLGLIPESAHWDDVTRRLNATPAETAAIREAFFAGDSIDRDLLAFIDAQRPALKTGVISNAWDGLRAYMTRENFIAPFDTIVISAEEGIAKPAPRIYQIALERLGVQAPEAIFVDDMPENIAAANALGMHGIQFKTPAQVMTDIKSVISVQRLLPTVTDH
jgi:glucose-1-phosphatase